MRQVLAAALLIALGSSTASAQHEHGATVAGRIPLEILVRPVGIKSGIGKVSHPASTKSAEAQAFYEQGLACLHSYQWLEAARSFNQAIGIDHDLAVAWVGLSRAYSGLEDPALARDAHKKAASFTHVTPREARWIAVRGTQLDAMEAGQGEKGMGAYRAYVAALDAAIEGDPLDAELWSQRGNAEEPGGAYGRGQRGTASSIAFYERAIALVPGHFGAHHYLIHTYENIGYFDKALEHGKVYADAASTVPHALHMYAHDLMKLGRTPEAIEVFGRANRLELDYYANEKISRDYDWHHSHNIALLALSHRHEGNLDEAERLLRDGASVEQQTPTRKGYYKGVLLDLLYARGQHDEVIKEATALAAWPQPAVKALGHSMAARSMMASGRVSDAAPHISALEAATSEGGMYGTFAELHAGLARAEYEMRTGKESEGAARLREVMKTARAQRTPDGWIEGLFTIESAFLVAKAVEDWELAADASARLLEHDKAYAGTKTAAEAVSGRRPGR